MDLFTTVINWLAKLLTLWFWAAVIGGVLILLADRRAHRRRPSEAAVRRAADFYRQAYGDRVHRVIGDHMWAATFAPDSRHRAFLRRVAAELWAGNPPDGGTLPPA